MYSKNSTEKPNLTIKYPNTLHIRENFCPLCAIVPLAIGGIGITSYSMTGEMYRQRRKLIILISLAFILIAIIIYFSIGDCSSCLAD